MNKWKNEYSQFVSKPSFLQNYHKKCLREMRRFTEKVEHHNYNSKDIRGKIENAL